MTNERKKALLFLSATLIVGILIGLLVPGIFHKYRSGHQHGRRGHGRGPDDKTQWFAGTIYRVVKPDSVQSNQIKPITEWASRQIEAVEANSNARLSSIMDSVRIQLKPILTEEQLQRLDEFGARAKEHWHGDRRK